MAEVVVRWRMAVVGVVEAGGHLIQVVKMVQADVILKELGEVAEEVLMGHCSGSALEVEVEVEVALLGIR